MNTFETDYVHAATADWLTDSGFEFEHEWSLPVNGRVDFYAWNNQTRLLVECKCNAGNLDRTIKQILGYVNQLPENMVYPALAIPRSYAKKDVEQQCAEQGIKVIPLPLSLTRFALALDIVTEKLVWEMAAERRTTPEDVIRYLIATHPRVIQVSRKTGKKPRLFGYGNKPFPASIEPDGEQDDPS